MDVENHTPESHFPGDLYHEIEQLSKRDWQLWSICALVIVVIAIGFAAFLLPNLVWASGVIHTDRRYLPQLFIGLITLIVLFNVYILDQKRSLNRTRGEMLRHLMESSHAKQVAIIDPLTKVFNRRYLEDLVPAEVSRAKRAGSQLSMLLIDINEFKQINSAYGHLGGDQYLRDLANLLKKTLRGSDTVVRIGGDEFLVLLPETGNAQAHRAAERLQWEARWWNQASRASYKLSFSIGVATYQDGMTVEEAMNLADKDMYRNKHEQKTTNIADLAVPLPEECGRRVYAMSHMGEA
ncbi:MAG: GGDEF domain-containing protein [Acidobacteria bacterium]|nr:GGDEF domain-containing protein [Acidobacteriota bacterium]